MKDDCEVSGIDYFQKRRKKVFSVILCFCDWFGYEHTDFQIHHDIEI